MILLPTSDELPVIVAVVEMLRIGNDDVVADLSLERGVVNKLIMSLLS